ncbi:MAG: homocysteine S-methyltransferase family protein [Lachnospiraceae bacterium]|nr:homocysteine S-methyltransferase family protein [Lachnospiraceae bacterium]
MNILDAIKERRLFFDGGTGTYLQERGLKPGEPPDLWNLERSKDIIGMHKAYLLAGADIIATNTFSASPLRFENYEEIIAAAIQNVRLAMKEAGKREGEAFVALDVGPTGRMLEPLGDLPFEEAVEAYAKIVRAAVPYGPDVILIETMNDSLETKAAVLAAKENSSLPVFVTNVYDENGTLMTGASPEAMVAMLEGLNVDAFGMNCSLGPEQMLSLVPRIMKITSTPVIVNPNAGLPRNENGKTVYDVGPDEFASLMREMALLGVNLM